MSDLFPPPPPPKIEDHDAPGDPFSAPAAMSDQQSDHYMENVEVENDMFNETNDAMHVIGEDDLLIKRVIEENDFLKPVQENNFLMPVLPLESGEGLPYAPVDWPSPGDVWTWRVGRRFNSSTGFFHDRFLYPPKRFQTLGRGKLCFASKAAVDKYIRSEFPDVDVNAFFASFTWRVPVKIPSPTKEAVPLNLEVPPPDETAEVKEVKEEFYRSGRKKRKSATTTPLTENLATESYTQNGDSPAATPRRKTKTPKQNGAVSSSKKKAGVSPSTSTRKSRRASKQSSAFTPNNEGHAKPQEQPIIHEIPADFDNYLNSLEDILAKPLSEASATYSATTEYPAAEDEMAEARSRLSSLLVMDFPSLVLSKNISELLALSTKLRKDPRLSAEQLVKLKLIEEIPSFSEVFLESRQTIDQVNNYFAALEANKAKVISLKSEYNALKDKADQLQGQVDSNLVAVEEIDKQIAQLQSWRAELTSTIESNKAAKVEVTSAQSVVANEIPTVVLEIQRSNTKMPEWELKKTNAEKREAEILAKFAPLNGFCL